ARRIEMVGRRLQSEKLPTVRPVLGTAKDPRLPAGLDAVLIVDVYHEMEDPVTLLENIARALKPQGRIGVVDFNPGGGGPGPAPDQRVDANAVISAAATAGFQVIARETVAPFQFLVVLGKAPGARP